MAREDLFYQPPKGEKSGLPYDPFKSFVIPRPIGWISTRSKDGVDNLAPYSQFTNVSFDPPTILFVAHQSVYKMRSKDTVQNCIETNEFVWNMATYALREEMNNSARESWDDEFVESNIAKAPCKVVRPPRVADSPVSFECQVQSIIRIPNESRGEDMSGPHLVGTSDIVIGRVLGIHVKGEYITDTGIFDVLKAVPIARMGYHQYTHVTQAWDMKVPMMPDDTMSAGVLGGNFDDVKQSVKAIETKGEEAEKAE
ncbi:hypothetical protein DL95DRAFT_529347 [Leptodontidium sp. 2 PMI_412]|nr:hypothetical protein DL95DRAFT_529347 [Leptodontidium sp. 2 PMI_412]